MDENLYRDVPDWCTAIVGRDMVWLAALVPVPFAPAFARLDGEIDPGQGTWWVSLEESSVILTVERLSRRQVVITYEFEVSRP